jgi:hypothetical protein
MFFSLLAHGQAASVLSHTNKRCACAEQDVLWEPAAPEAHCPLLLSFTVFISLPSQAYLSAVVF